MFNTYSLTANGTAGPHDHFGGLLNVQAAGTWDSGTLSVQVDMGSGYTEVASWTANEETDLSLRAGCQVKYVLSGASSPSLTISAQS